MLPFMISINSILFGHINLARYRPAIGFLIIVCSFFVLQYIVGRFASNKQIR